ncbi:MAG: FCD domain-containing protein [Bacillota bacterium]|nr:FCD domain-containing protein [Bacillota bacterium]
MDGKYERQLMQTGLFSSRTNMISYLLMHFISQKNEAAGSWALRDDLLSIGVDCSTATIGRYLKELDYREYTVQKSNMGRVLTPVGKAFLNDMEEKLERTRIQTELSKAVKVTEHSELVELLYVRRALETEAVRLAVENATPKELKMLMKKVAAHKDTVLRNEDPTDVALDFHATVAEISHNKFVKSILKMLIYEEKRIESTIETLVTRERGRIYAKEHEEIATAISEHKAQTAEKLMFDHISELCSAVMEQVKE